MAKPVKTVDGRTCTVCGKGATGPWEPYMEPRCLEHSNALRPPTTGRAVEEPKWLQENEAPARFVGKHPALAADYGALELRVLVSLMNHLSDEVAREMCRTIGMDEATARAMVQATIRAFASNGPLSTDDLRYQPPLMTATEINALPRKAREYIHQLVANTDPTGMVRENMQLIDTNKGLQTMYRNRTDEVDKLKAVLERVKTGMEWTRCELPACWNSVDDEMLAEINEVLK